MISSLRGTVLFCADGRLELEVHGVGYAVAVTLQHALGLHVGDETLVHTALIVREDDQSLFGFASRDELAVFDLLRSVTGVGPKSALGVLAAMTPAQIAAAVAGEDDAAFRRVSGIGPKTAKLIILSLAGKLSAIGPSSIAHADAAAPGTVPASVRADVVLALVGLGWNERVAADAIDGVLQSGTAETTVAALLRQTLAHLGPTR
jgi:Holliday junction DNA helicase RuvA